MWTAPSSTAIICDVQAWVEAFRSVGHPIDAAAIHRLVGMGGSEIVEQLLPPGMVEQLAARVKAEHTASFRALLPWLRRFDGAAELLPDGRPWPCPCRSGAVSSHF